LQHINISKGNIVQLDNSHFSSHFAVVVAASCLSPTRPNLPSLPAPANPAIIAAAMAPSLLPTALLIGIATVQCQDDPLGAVSSSKLQIHVSGCRLRMGVELMCFFGVCGGLICVYLI
jgi:hypothetical protein